MYTVILKYTSGLKEGIIDWISFADKQIFENWFSPDMRNFYEVVDRGVPQNKTPNITSIGVNFD